MDDKKLATILANTVGFIVLVLVLYQEIFMGQYWANQIGIASQFYFLPLLSIAFGFTTIFQTMSATYIVAFSMMCMAFYLGCYASKRYTK